MVVSNGWQMEWAIRHVWNIGDVRGESESGNG